jgi:hypothetical protein
MDDEIYFWEVDGIYDTDGDLLIWSLLSVFVISLEEAMFSHQGFIKPFLEEII